ncbi:MAG TPA: TipAS antibiotic-recognition domain-containing protein [Candidatus Jeotgalibaca merdavium]|uniref:TipAS antibiotic-recognition domain-containing protein n=1 Tax=Candidatus Jeotgalibaca merdavium TaxID=2838627 RepID=A0A9D2I0X3_9LACT|nr:TipAS antibiotic-recognition domain-containing protein [Candidatus Jeotgalibaca merdavium]
MFRDLAEVRHLDPASKQAQESIEKWYLHLQSITTYSLEAFKGLGQMYVDDDRFRKNIDQFGDGLALFMRNAMAIYADNHQ